MIQHTFRFGQNTANPRLLLPLQPIPKTAVAVAAVAVAENIPRRLVSLTNMTGAHRVFPGASSFQRAIGAAKKRGRKLKWVDADGNCFFYAVALQLMFLGLLTS